jgi:hypothetical protein
MNEPLASLDLPCAPVELAHRENGLKPPTSRDTRENSNMRFIDTPIGSRFVAVIDPTTIEIFSPDFAPDFGVGGR